MRAPSRPLALCGLALSLIACGRGELEPLLRGDAGVRDGTIGGRDATVRDGSIGDGPSGDSGDGDVQGVRLEGIALSPPEATMLLGTRLFFVATGLYSDGSTQDITALAAWSSEGAAIAQSGNLTAALGPGEGLVSATLDGLTASARVRVLGAEVLSLAITPPVASAPIGTVIGFSAEATLSDGTIQDVTRSVTWDSLDPGVAVIDGLGQATTQRPGFTVIIATFAGFRAEALLEVSGATLIQLQVEPVDPVLAIGTSLSMRAIGLYSDMSIVDVTARVRWSSSDAAIFTLAPDGSGRALAEGASVVVAELDGLRGASTITVSPATLVSVRITPETSVIAVMGTVQLTFTGEYSDGTTRDLTTSARWTSSDANIGPVSNTAGSQGLVTGLAAGAVEVRATFGGQTARARVIVSPATVLSVTITPSPATVGIGGTVALRALATYSDGTQRDITDLAAWQSGDTFVATVSGIAGSAGVVTGVAEGRTIITATLDGVSGQAGVIVSAAGLLGIDISPANATTTAGLRSSYTATGRYADGTQRDLTTQVTWTTADAAIATISNVAGARGQLLARAPGTTQVIATFMGVSGRTSVTVQGATLVSLTVAPLARSAAVGTTVQYSAVAIYSDGTQRNVSGQSMWSSSAAAVASISPQGTARALSVGRTTITASFMGLSGNTTLTVTEAQLVSISISPAAVSLTAGAVQRFSAQGIYSDGTSRSVTMQATWQSSAPMVAQVSSNGRTRGEATALSIGVATISATFQGVTGTAQLTVTSAQIASIQITPFAPMMVIGSQLQLQAVAVFTDGTSMDVTTRATWVSSAPGIAQVSTGGRNGMRGLTSAFAQGTATISATFMGLSGTTIVTVTSATVLQLQVTPFAPTIPVGFGAAMRATAILSDGTTRDVTSLATWVSSNPQAAAVSNAAQTKGLLSTLTVGVAEIRASYLGIGGASTVTVTSETLVSLTIVPSPVVLAVGETRALRASGTFSAGTTLDLTNDVTWSSSAPMTADVANAIGIRGFATGLAPGRATLQAQRGMVVGSAPVLVN